MLKLLSIALGLFPFVLFGQAVDSLAIKKIDSLLQVSRALANKKDFDKALEINAEAEKFALEKWGQQSEAFATACLYHGLVFEIKGAYAEAEKWYADAKTIREKVLGKEHRDYLKVLNTLAGVYLNLKNFSKSEQLYLEYKTTSEQTGKQEDYAIAIGNLALLYDEMGNFGKAESAHLESIAFREKLSGKENMDYATGVNNLGLTYLKNGKFDKSEPLLLEGKLIRERILGKEHPHYSSSINNLANLYANLANYEKALPFAIEAKELRGKVLGKNHPRYGWSLNNLATLYSLMGDYEQAELYFLEALEVKEKTLGKKHSDYAKSLNNLAVVSRSMGNFAKAEMQALEAKSINESNLGKEHPDYLTSLENLGNLYAELGDYNKAETYMLERKRITEKILGTSHPEYSTNLSNLANLYHDKGAYGIAEGLYLEADTLMKKVLGTEHPSYAANLHNLAANYLAIGEYKKAEPLFLRAKAIREKKLGNSSPQYLASLDKLARFYWQDRRLTLAKPYLEESSDLEKKLLVSASRHLSEREMASYIRKFENGLDRDFSFAQVQTGMTPVCYNNILFHKGYLLNAVSQVSKLALADTVSTEQYLQLRSFERRLATEYAKPLGDQKDIATLEAKSNAIEKELTRRVAGFGAALRQVSWEEVQQKLKPGEAAIEFLHYKFINPNPTDSILYAALVLKPDAKTPVLIPLFEEKHLDTLFQSKGKKTDEYVNALYGSSSANSLYSLIWKPLEKILEGTKTIYFSSSGLLHRLNLGAIALPQLLSGQANGQTISDRYQLVELGSTRSLVIPLDLNAGGADAVLYGGIQYEIDTAALAKTPMGWGTSGVATRGELGLSNMDSTMRGRDWNYLKWTDVEIGAIEALLSDAGLNATVRRNYDATEESFNSFDRLLPGKKKKSPQILHIATHGFFFPDPQKTVNEQGSKPNSQLVFKISDHPMIRSGLVLAGGNYAWRTGKPFRPNMEDGILTAYEISQMNLSNTELVVLSACETGLGDIQGNEGVYGLQRAFKIAGAKYLIMSLWQVPDFHTQELMTAFYTNWIEIKMTVPEAFRSAQKTMREQYKDPFLWAGFILVE